MMINQHIDGGMLKIMPVGRLDSITSDDFLAFTEQKFTKDFDKLIIDFTDVDYISSKGLRVILLIYKQLNGRKMEIIGANASVQEVFHLTGFSEVFGVK